MPSSPDPASWWGSARGDGNRSRSSLCGRGGEPVLLGSADTGADVRFVREVRLGDSRPVLVQAGSTLQLLDWAGTSRWQRLTEGVLRVLGVVDDPPRGRPFAVVLGGERELELLDLDDGHTLWRWQAPEGTNLSGAGSTLLTRANDRVLLVCFPTYATTGHCFDLCAADGPAVRWERDFGSTFDAGFGPVIVIGDPLELGRPTLVMSTRTGSAYDAGDPDDSNVATDRLVLGREDGHLHQGVLDLDTGETLADTSYRPDPGPYPCARPYGLLQVARLAPDTSPDVVLVSCQVEEYLSVTSTTAGTLSRRWGHFVEKDWPVDVHELRPQVTSLADVRGDGRPLLVVGHWHDGEWNTLLIDPLRGWDDGLVATLRGRYFWGCHDLDGDGVPELVVSVETQRRPSARTRLEIVDGRTLEVRAALDHARILSSADSEIPEGMAFHAERASTLAVPDAEGRLGLLVHHAESTVWWTLAAGAPRQVVLLREPAPRADHRAGRLILTRASGALVGYDEQLRPVAEVGVHGRRPEPLTIEAAGTPLVVAACGDGTVAGWRLGCDGLEECWRIPGSSPALHADGDGVARLAVSTRCDDEHRVTAYRIGPDGAQPTLDFEVALPAVPVDLLSFGPAFRLGVNLRTGVHTAAFLLLDERGQELWRDDDHGAHPNRPGAFDLPERGWVVAYDDHGELTVRLADTGDVVGEASWTAAYTTPVQVPGTDVIIRADGVHGVEAVRGDGTRAWRREAELWSHYRGDSALAHGPDGWQLCSVTRSGEVQALRASDGTDLWRLGLGSVPDHRPVVALDVDGDGSDELVAGTTAGDVRCLRLGGAAGWSFPIGTQVQSLAVGDLDGDGRAELVVGGADGRLRVLRI